MQDPDQYTEEENGQTVLAVRAPTELHDDDETGVEKRLTGGEGARSENELMQSWDVWDLWASWGAQGKLWFRLVLVGWSGFQRFR